MPTLNALVRDQAALEPAHLEQLHLLVGDWQLLSDLSFADLVLWVPRRDGLGGGFVAVAHCRPSTGATVYYDDVVGTVVPAGRRQQLDRAFATGRICRERDPEWQDDVPVREETIPVRAGGTGGPVVGVLSRHTNLAAARTPSRLELTYMHCADDLAGMVAEGEFPPRGAPTGPRRGAPRVGDGLLRLDVEGVCTYASPNAQSAFHRLGLVGDLAGRSLPEVVTRLVQALSPVDESLPLVVTGRAPWRTDVEANGTTLSLRAIPLLQEGVRRGALLLLRDVTELRRRERELLTKEATIREIHHRVKNNLQAVAALLRLQSRRTTSEEARSAMDEAIRRVATIALVHETLSRGFDETVDFDEVADRVLALAAEVAIPARALEAPPVRVVREGRFGPLAAEDATPLALVLTELVTNAVEHGLGDRGGLVEVRVEREGERLGVEVADDGVGLPAGFSPGRGGLGTQIVAALVGELRGSIEWTAPERGGTEVRVRVLTRPVALLGEGVDDAQERVPASA